MFRRQRTFCLSRDFADTGQGTWLAPDPVNSLKKEKYSLPAVFERVKLLQGLDMNRRSSNHPLERIMQGLRRELRHRSPGERLPSIETLSRQWQVSINTVYAAVRLLQHEGRIISRHGSGVYVTERGARSCVAIVTDTDIFDPRISGFHAQAPRALRSHLHSHHVGTRLYVGFSAPGGEPNRTPPEEFLVDLKAGLLDGVAAFDLLPDPGWLDETQRRGVPVVGNRWYPYGVDFDVLEIIPEAVRRLKGRGCRNLALLAWSSQTVGPAFREALAAEGLPFRERWVRHDLHPLAGGAGWEELREIWSAYPEKPDGLIITDDNLLWEALPALVGVGVRIPEELRIAAHANRGSEIRVPFPVLWFRMDPERYACHQAELLLKLMAGATPSQDHIRVPFEWSEDETGGSLSPSGTAGRRTSAIATVRGGSV